MSGNKKKAKRRTAKALQNLRKTPEKVTHVVAETKNPLRYSHEIDDYDDEVTAYKSEFTEYGKRLIEHYAKVYSGIDDPDFAFEDNYEEDEEEYEEADVGDVEN